MLPVQMTFESMNAFESDPFKNITTGSSPSGKEFRDVFDTAVSNRQKSSQVTETASDPVKTSEGNDLSSGKQEKPDKKDLEKNESEKLVSLDKSKAKKDVAIRSDKSHGLIKGDKPAKLDELKIKMAGKSLEDGDEAAAPAEIQDEWDEVIAAIKSEEKQPETPAEAQMIFSNAESISSAVKESLEAGSGKELKGSTEKIAASRTGEKSSGKNVGKNQVQSEGKDPKKISVVDLRKQHAAGKSGNDAEKNSDPVSMDKKILMPDGDLKDSGKEDLKPITVEISHVRDNYSGESKTVTTSTANAVLKQLEESVNGKIIKQSQIILKDNNSGEIKLILKPEELGRVRIRLSLNDNRIAGQISVENNSIKEIFQQNLQNLEKAFRESGFDTASLNVSVGGGRDGRDGQPDGSGDTVRKLNAVSQAAPEYAVRNSDNLIDLMV